MKAHGRGDGLQDEDCAPDGAWDMPNPRPVMPQPTKVGTHAACVRLATVLLDRGPVALLTESWPRL
jgi:hypothetical protein